MILGNQPEQHASGHRAQHRGGSEQPAFGKGYIQDLEQNRHAMARTIKS
jgi:hypothetical protein